MEKVTLCRGGCGNKAIYKGWCGIKWKRKNRVCVTCPELERKRGKSISAFRIQEAKLGLNPMQNKEICRKNHSVMRNMRASETLKKIGKLGFLPQQTESKKLHEIRLMRIRRVLRKLAKKGQLNHQLESKSERKRRFEKIAITLRALAKEGKLPMQNLSKEQKIKFGKKLSLTLRRKFRSGELKLNNWGKRYRYRGLRSGDVILRSKWEREVAKFLDKYGINWEYEALTVPYYDKESNLLRNTVPDFYIPSANLFIEVKSNGEFRSQNTQDKLKGISKRGYKALLFGKKQIKALREDPESLLLGINN